MKKNNHTSSEIALDAFNTANKCGLLPSELLGQRDELLYLAKSLKWMVDELAVKYNDRSTEFDICEQTRRYYSTINQIEQ